jgi:hypothetical protein
MNLLALVFDPDAVAPRTLSDERGPPCALETDLGIRSQRKKGYMDDAYAENLGKYPLSHGERISKEHKPDC